MVASGTSNRAPAKPPLPLKAPHHYQPVQRLASLLCALPPARRHLKKRTLHPSYETLFYVRTPGEFNGINLYSTLKSKTKFSSRLSSKKASIQTINVVTAFVTPYGGACQIIAPCRAFPRMHTHTPSPPKNKRRPHPPLAEERWLRCGASRHPHTRREKGSVASPAQEGHLRRVVQHSNCQ